MEKIFEGNTVAEALQKGLLELGVSLDEVEREVISQPKSGFFGFGSSKAKVKIILKSELEKINKEKAKKISDETSGSQSKKPAKTKIAQAVENNYTNKIEQNFGEQNSEIEEVIYTKKENLSQDEQKAKEFIDGLLEKMGIEGQAEICEGKAKVITVNIVGKGMGNVIGRRGDNLDAIQYITNLVVKNNNETETKVRIDCENYRAKRDVTLERVALKMGHKVLKYNKNMTLEPMNPYERRLIHEVLQNFRGVHTYSTGKEPNRRVVIAVGDEKSAK